MLRAVADDAQGEPVRGRTGFSLEQLPEERPRRVSGLISVEVHAPHLASGLPTCRDLRRFVHARAGARGFPVSADLRGCCPSGPSQNRVSHAFGDPEGNEFCILRSETDRAAMPS